MTFSITGRDGQTGMLGVAVATKHWAVGSRVPYVHAKVAALAVQAYAQPYIGYDTLKLMMDTGYDGPTALKQVLAADPGRDWRQVGLVDVQGHVMGYTGHETDPWSGHKVGTDCVGAGNMLVNAETVSAMVDSFESHTDLELPDRLVLALQAGHAAGGDRRGQQSAAVYVVHLQDAPYADLRIDDHPNAVAELARLTEATRTDWLTRSRHFASTRETRPLSEYKAHQAKLRAG
jgi:uncharacterized Ntn-hydrolase superfamily protein